MGSEICVQRKKFGLAVIMLNYGFVVGLYNFRPERYMQFLKSLRALPKLPINLFL